MFFSNTNGSESHSQITAQVIPELAGSKSQQEKLQLLMPHISRAQRMMSAQQKFEQELANTIEVLDRLAYGVMLLDEQTKVTYKNRIANWILAQQDGLYLDNNGHKNQLKTHIKTAQSRLDAAISDIVTHKKQHRVVADIAIPRPSGNLPFILQMSPMLNAQVGKTKGIIFIKDAQNSQICSASTLQAAFGLTESEAQIALLSSQFQTVEEIAGKRNVGVSTVKTQLSTIFEKTQTASRAELVRLMMMLAMPKFNA